MATSGKNPDPAWQRHKATIHRLYIIENKKLDDIMCEMRTSYGFSASKYQYTTMLKAWGLQKNAKAEIWEGISGSLKRRRLEASEVEVYFHDSRLHLKKLKKELQRYPTPEDALTPTTPEGIMIVPRADYIRSEPCPIPRSLTISLPWRELVDSWNLYRDWRSTSQLALPTASPFQVLSPYFASWFPDLYSVNLLPDVFSPAPWGDVEPLLTGGIAIQDFVLEESSLGDLMPLNLDVRKCFGIKFKRSGIDLKGTLETHLRPYVIEKQPKETHRATQELMNPFSTASMLILTSYMALLLSNDLIGSQAIETFLAKAEETHHLGNIIPLFTQSSPSARAIATRLLHAAVRINATKFLREAFQSGADLESPSTGMSSLTLLQAALISGKYESARVLIIAGADVNAVSSVPYSGYRCYGDHMEGVTCECEVNGPDCPISLAAKSSTCVDLIPELVGRGATIPEHNPVLTHAIRAGASADTTSCLTRAGADIQMCSWNTPGRTRSWDPFPIMDTPLSAAAENCNLQVIRRLLEAGAHPDGPLRVKIRERIPAEFELPRIVQSPLIRAITSRRANQAEELREIVQLLLGFGADPNLPSLECYTLERYKLERYKLERYTLEYCASLYQHGSSEFLEEDEECNASYWFYPLQAAVRLDDFELVQLLLQNKASPNSIYGISALAEAASNSNTSIARLLLSLGADPDGFDRGCRGKSALVAAVEGENLELVDLLLGAGADINNCPAYYGGRTPLQRAAEAGNTRVIDHLLRHGASMLSPPAAVKGVSVPCGFVRSGLHDYLARALRAGAYPNGGSVKGCSPLAAAVIGGDVVSVNLLVTAGADVHEYARADYEEEDLFKDAVRRGKRNYRYFQVMRDAKLSPIQWAAFLNLAEIARILFEARVNVNQPPFDNDGSMALHLAVCQGNYTVVQLLLEQKAEVGALSNSETALDAAIKSGSDSVLDLLLRNGADPNQPSFQRSYFLEELKPTTPLDIACNRGQLSAVRILLANGADISQGCAAWIMFRDPVYLRDGGYLISDSTMDILELLIQAGVDVNKRYSEESTPLEEAILHEEFHCANRLITAGAHINATASTGKLGRTALQAAAEVGSIDWVERLLLEGADINAPAAQDNGVTALQAAAIKGYLRIAQILLEHGAIIDAPASAINGRTAIDGAAEFGRIDMVKLLLDNYEGPTPISTLRNSAYQAAKKGNQWFVMKLLEAYEHPSEAWSRESWRA